jgi:hypothetical protein
VRDGEIELNGSDYLWICLWFYQGKFVYPTSVDDIRPFFHRMGTHIYEVSPLVARSTHF